MTTLRDRVRSTLGRTAPSEPEAQAELDAILTRAKRAPRARMYRAAYAVVVLAAIVFGIVKWRKVPPPVAQSDHGSHLYIHITGEPPEAALALDLTSKGAR